MNVGIEIFVPKEGLSPGSTFTPPLMAFKNMGIAFIWLNTVDMVQNLIQSIMYMGLKICPKTGTES